MINAPTLEPPKVNWEMKTLGEVCLTTAGGTPLKSKREYYENGDIPWLLSGEVCQKEITSSKNFITRIGVENSSAKLYPPDSVLIAMYGATAGQAGILRFEATSNQAVCAILPNEQYLPEFIYYFFLNEKKTLVAKAAGNAQPNISQKKIKDTSIPVPPLAEQERIVGILDEAFEGIAAATAQAEKNLHNARELFQSVLQSTFSQKGDDWVETRLGDICHKITDGKHGDCRGQEGSGFYFLSAKDVKNGTLNYEKAREITRDDFEETHRRTNLEAGDILVTNSGTIGRMAIAPCSEKTSRTTFQKSVAILKPIKQRINTKFAFHSLSSAVSRFVNLSAGAAQKNLLLRDLREFRFKMPLSLEHQQAIAEKLDALSEETKALEAIYERKQSALCELKQSLLQKAFAGEL